MLRTGSWLLLVVAALTGRSALADGPEALPADERLLRSARLGTDGPALLEFFRSRIVTDVQTNRARALVRQLGDALYLERERASAKLAAMGPVAAPVLRGAVRDPDLEIARRAEECLRLIEERDYGPPLVAAAARLAAARQPPGAAPVLLSYLPWAEDDQVAEEIRTSLAALVTPREGIVETTFVASLAGPWEALAADCVRAEPERVLRAALTDAHPLRRAAGGEALCRADLERTRPDVRKLLQDPDATVRLRVALAMAARREKDAIPVLIDVLPLVSLGQAWQAEDVLYRLAEGQEPPPVSLGKDAVSRRQARDAWSGWWKEHSSQVDLARLDATPRLLGYTLLVLLDMGRILELDAHGKVRWQLDGFEFPLDAQMLPNDRILAAEYEGGKVTERDLKGAVVWKRDLDGPLVAQRLPNGHTFMANQDQLIEVDRDGKVVLTLMRPGGQHIMKAQKLRNGEIACVTTPQPMAPVQRFVRLDPAGKVLQSFPVHVKTSGGRIEVLANGHVLVPEHAAGRVVEYDANGQPVWEARIDQPIAAVRLPNGNTLVTSMSQMRAVEFDRSGKEEVWQYKDTTRVTRAFRR